MSIGEPEWGRPIPGLNRGDFAVVSGWCSDLDGQLVKIVGLQGPGGHRTFIRPSDPDRLLSLHFSFLRPVDFIEAIASLAKQ